MKEADLTKFMNLQEVQERIIPLDTPGTTETTVEVFSKSDPDIQATFVDGSTAALGMTLREIIDQFGSLQFQTTDPNTGTDHTIDLSHLGESDLDDTLVVVGFLFRLAEGAILPDLAIREQSRAELGIRDSPKHYRKALTREYTALGDDGRPVE